jgi:DNA-binding NarL/FixJ family response regulator
VRVLVAHPSPFVANGLATAISEECPGLSTTCASTLADATLAIADLRPAIAVIDVTLAPGHELGLCDRLVADHVPVIIMTHPGTPRYLALLEHGASGIVMTSDGLPGVVAGIRTVLDGHVHVPPHLLGAVLHDLIVQRRDDASAPADRLASLSPREREVLSLLGSGADTREIGLRLVISPHTAKTHINRLLGKLGMTSRAEAAAFALDHQLRPPMLEASRD